LVSLLSLVGLAFVSVDEAKLKRIIFFIVSLAVGGLFGDAFIHLLPESFERLASKLQASVLVLAGIFAFFALEKFLLWRHQHVLESDHAIHPVGYMNLLADGAHNFIDGAIIGASYVVSLHVGIATTLAANRAPVAVNFPSIVARLLSLTWSYRILGREAGHDMGHRR
jgi:zinc and cadmium transporter